MIQLLGKKDAGKTKRDAVDEDEITQFQSGAAGAGALEQREKEDEAREQKKWVWRAVLKHALYVAVSCTYFLVGAIAFCRNESIYYSRREGVNWYEHPVFSRKFF